MTGGSDALKIAKDIVLLASIWHERDGVRSFINIDQSLRRLPLYNVL